MTSTGTGVSAREARTGATAPWRLPADWRAGWHDLRYLIQPGRASPLLATRKAEAILPRVLEEKTLLFGSLSGARSLRENPPARFIFNYRASYREEIAALVSYFVNIEAVDANTFAVFYQ